MSKDRLGLGLASPRPAPGWSISTLVHPAALAGANGMRWGPDGQLYVAQAFGSQVSAVNLETAGARIVSAANGAIIAPDDLAFDSHGSLYVTEVMSARVSAIRPGGAIDIIAADVPVANGISVHADRIFMSEFHPEGRILELFADGSAPRLIADGLMMPNALSLGPDGLLYFPLVPLGEVWRISVEGGAPERFAGGFDVPVAVKFDSAGLLHVVESGSGAVTRLDLTTGRRSDVARLPFGTDNLAFAPDGRLFVSNFTSGCVNEIALDGTVRTAVAGGMSGPFGLSTTPGGMLVAADGMSVAWISAQGEVHRPAMLLQHGFPGYVRGIAAEGEETVIVTNSAGQVSRYAPGGEAVMLAEGLDRAMGIAIDRDGTIAVVEQGSGSVVAISPDGALRRLASGLAEPTGIAPAPLGGFLVAEAGAGRVLHVNGGECATVAKGLIAPHGLAVCSDGKAYVLDRGDGSLHALGGLDQRTELICSGLPAGTGGAMAANVPPGIAGLMPGPLLPFSDIAALADGSIAVGADAAGSIVVLRPS